MFPVSEWMQEVLDLCKEKTHHPRKVFWYWSFEGSVGKSTLVRHICIRYPNRALVVGGNAHDIKAALAILDQKKKVQPDLIFLDLPRSARHPVDYGGIEEVKNGLFFSGKYESGMVMLKKFPLVVVFSNYAPSLAMLSEDRWVVKRIV